MSVMAVSDDDLARRAAWTRTDAMWKFASGLERL